MVNTRLSLHLPTVDASSYSYIPFASIFVTLVTMSCSDYRRCIILMHTTSSKIGYKSYCNNLNFANGA